MLTGRIIRNSRPHSIVSSCQFDLGVWKYVKRIPDARLQVPTEHFVKAQNKYFVASAKTKTSEVCRKCISHLVHTPKTICFRRTNFCAVRVKWFQDLRSLASKWSMVQASSDSKLLLECWARGRWFDSQSRGRNSVGKKDSCVELWANFRVWKKIVWLGMIVSQ